MKDFLIDQGTVNWWPIEAGLIYQARYSLAAYRQALFEQLNVPFAENVQHAVPKRQAEYLVGRYCANKALTQLGKEVTEIRTGQHRQPLWPEGIVGSISHSNEAALACVSRSNHIIGLGIDLEEIVNSTSMEKIESSILTERDKQCFAGCTLPRETLFTIIFSLKESFFKAAYAQVGKYFDFDAVSVEAIDETNGIIHFCVNYNLSNTILKGQVYQGGYKLWIDRIVVTFVQLQAGK